MDGYKGLLASRTFWGAVISVVCKLLAVLGYNVTDGDEQQLVAVAMLAVSGIGDFLAVYGRVKATKRIGK